MLHRKLKAIQARQQARRIVTITVLFGIAFLIIILRLWHLQIIQEEYFSDLSQNNRIRIQRVKSPRGIIFDSHGYTLVSNRPNFQVGVTLEDVKMPLDTVLERLGKLLEVDKAQLYNRIRQSEHHPFQPVILKHNLSLEEVARIEEHKLELSGVSVLIESVRDYPLGEGAAHLLGYMGEITKGQLENADNARKFKQGDYIGQFGLEQVFNITLTGADGGKQVEVNAEGRVLQEVGSEEPGPGLNLVLTLDAALQRKAEEQLAGKAGAIVALNPQNGKVLCMVSRPAFDPNIFAAGVPPKVWAQLNRDPKKPLQNRAIQGQYPSGSVFKIVMATAALEQGALTPETSFYCPGFFRLGNGRYGCWRKEGHGTISMHRAILDSCDVYFYNVGQLLGVNNIAKWAFKYGLGQPSGIDIPNEKAGLVPTPEWRQRKFGAPWQGGETVSFSIGQGFLNVTPLQLANVAATIANGGTLYKPQVIEKIMDDDGKVYKTYHTEIINQLGLHKSTVEVVQSGLSGVVNEHGTGTKAAVPGILVAGKTGTAQVVRKALYEDVKNIENIPEECRDHAWFVAFAPVENAEIAMSILVEHGGHGGSACAPIAKELIQEYFRLKQERSAPPLEGGDPPQGVQPLQGGHPPITLPVPGKEAPQQAKSAPIVRPVSVPPPSTKPADKPIARVINHV